MNQIIFGKYYQISWFDKQNRKVGNWVTLSVIIKFNDNGGIIPIQKFQTSRIQKKIMQNQIFKTKPVSVFYVDFQITITQQIKIDFNTERVLLK